MSQGRGLLFVDEAACLPCELDNGFQVINVGVRFPRAQEDLHGDAPRAQPHGNDGRSLS